MDDLDSRVRRGAKLMILMGFLLGLLVGVPAGLAISEYYGERVVVIPYQPGVEV